MDKVPGPVIASTINYLVNEVIRLAKYYVTQNGRTDINYSWVIINSCI